MLTCAMRVPNQSSRRSAGLSEPVIEMLRNSVEPVSAGARITGDSAIVGLFALQTSLSTRCPIPAMQSLQVRRGGAHLDTLALPASGGTYRISKCPSGLGK